MTSDQDLEARLIASRKKREDDYKENITPPTANAVDDEEDEMEVREAWSSGKLRPSWAPKASHVESQTLQTLKDHGNASLKAGNFKLAVQLYGEAIVKGKQDRVGLDQLAIFYSNRSAAFSKLEDFAKAVEDARVAVALQPTWPKPYYRLALALGHLGDHDAAIKTCRQGERLYDTKSGNSTDLQPLLGSPGCGGCGRRATTPPLMARLLEVREAGEDAWLGQPAPPNPDLDPPDNGDMSLPASVFRLVDRGTRVTCGRRGPRFACGVHPAFKNLSFRSVRDAVAAAQDGDRVFLQPGIHNGLGETITVTKRILIIGGGTPADTKLDHRANSPAFRIERACVIKGIDIDMTGFREAVLVKGGPGVRPLLDRLPYPVFGRRCCQRG
eukprot:jgi/Botrbrau1/1104/Bobra.0162s0005.1